MPGNRMGSITEENFATGKLGEGVTCAHSMANVYPEMLAQICHDYAGLPDPRTLTLSEIRFFYNWLRPALHQRTKGT